MRSTCVCTIRDLQRALGCSMLACFAGPRYVLHGTRGSFVKYGMDPQEEKLRLTNAIAADGWGEDSEDQWGTLTSCDGTNTSHEKVKTEPGDYRGFYSNIRDAITQRAPLAVTPQQAFRVIRAIELAYPKQKRASRTVTWTELPLEPQLRKRSAFPITLTELKLIATLAIIGLSNNPKTG